MPDNPKRLQIIDRVVKIIGDIKAGENYFLTPIHVAKGFVAEPKGFPCYMVISDSGGEIIMNMDNLWEETFYISIRGIVQAPDDVVTPLEKAIRDIRKAIGDDFKWGAEEGSLLTLASEISIDSPPDIDYGFEGTSFFGFFSQRVRVRVFGEMGEI